MGLDVYLRRAGNRAQALANQELCEKMSDKLWSEAGAYDTLSEEQKEKTRAAIKAYNAAYNCDEYGSSNDIETVEIDSKIHPDNMFKIGYLRSSYNSGGINSVLKRIGCPDLYDIFEPTEDYYFTPDWLQAQARAQIAIDKLKEHMGGPMGDYDVIEVNGYDPVGSKEEALELLKHELEQKSAWGGGYSNRKGDWFLEGLKIVGAVPGKPSRFGGNPTYYLFTKSEKPGGNLQWYLEALEVTKEMIDYVLAQPDADNYFLSWSA